MYQSAPADLTVNIFEKTKVLIFIDYPLCAAFGPLLCLSGGQGRSKATPANIAVYVYKMFFHSVQKLLYRLQCVPHYYACALLQLLRKVRTVSVIP